MTKKSSVDYDYFYEVANKIITGGRFEEMRKYISHSNFTVYDHCINVAKKCYTYATNHDIKCNLEDLIIGALLHDYYLYDWHEKSTWHKWHGFKHHKFAAVNAVKDFGVDDRVKNAIQTHMFPLTFWKIPTSKEAWIICVVDKIVATKETFEKYKK